VMACFPSNSGFRPKRPEERDMTSGTWPPRASDFPSPPPISTKREQLAPEATRAGAGRLQDWAGEDPDRTCAGRGERSWRALPSATGRQHQGIAWVIVDGPRVVSSRQPPLRNGRRSGHPRYSVSRSERLPSSPEGGTYVKNALETMPTPNIRRLEKRKAGASWQRRMAIFAESPAT